MTLYIAYPDIPWRAKTVTLQVGTVSDTAQGVRNTIHVERNIFSRITPVGNNPDTDIRYDLGSGLTASASYLIFARADRFIAGETNLDVALQYDNGGWVTAHGSSFYLDGVALVGPREEDYLLTFAETSAYRNWRLYVDGTVAAARNLSKFYFGNAFQMGVDPDFSWDIEFEEVEDYSESGARELYRHNLGRYVFSFEWQSVTDDKAQEFFQYIVRQSHRHHYFLYTTAQHQVLNNFRCVHVRLRESRTENPDGVADRNNITAVFEEVIG